MLNCFNKIWEREGVLHTLPGVQPFIIHHSNYVIHYSLTVSFFLNYPHSKRTFQCTREPPDPAVDEENPEGETLVPSTGTKPKTPDVRKQVAEPEPESEQIQAIRNVSVKAEKNHAKS